VRSQSAMTTKLHVARISLLAPTPHFVATAPIVRAAVCLLLAAFLFTVAGTATLRAQASDQVVDSLDGLQRRIEALVGDRLSSLMPSQTYVLRAMVLGHKIMVPRGSTTASGAFDLPGFQPSAGQPVSSDEKYVVDQIIVRIVLNQDLNPQDIQYLRTIVPILADFRPERGDRLDLQAVPAFNRQPNGQPYPQQPGSFLPQGQGAGQQQGIPGQPQGQPGQPSITVQMPGYPQQPNGQAQGALGQQAGDSSGLFPTLGTGGRSLTAVDWIFIALLGLILLVMVAVMVRVFIAPRAPAAAAYAMPGYGGAVPMQGMGSQVSMSRGGQAAAPSYGMDAGEFEQQRYYESLKAGVIKVLFARPDVGRLMVQEWQSHSDKLVMLLHALGPQVARQALLQPLGMTRYRDLEEDMRGQNTPDRGKMVQALREANSYLLSKELEHPEEIKADPFAFLDELSKGQIGHLIKNEPVKVKAMVLSRLKPEDVAFIIEQYPKDMQLEIAVNIGNLHSLPLEMMDGVALDLAQKTRSLPDARTVDIEGPTALVDLMGRASQDTSLYLLQAMKAKDRKLSEAVEKRFFLFDAIPLVPDDVLPQAVRGMPSAVVVTALTGSPQDLQRKVLMAFPEQARAGLVNSLRASKSQFAEIEDARRQVVARFQLLARQGKIDLKQISDAWQAQARSTQPAA
jgi:flagellar motor switch protein FliG